MATKWIFNPSPKTDMFDRLPHRLNGTFAVLLAIAIAQPLIGQAQELPSGPSDWKPGLIPDGYRVETIGLPHLGGFSVTGLDVANDGVVWMATREGEVWTLKDRTWKLFADGLNEPTGLLVAPDGRVFVSQKPELTELVDQDQDGVAELYRNVASEWGISDNYHEYNHGLVMNKKGSIFGTLNLTHGGTQYGGKGGMGHGAKYRGWAYEVTPDGKWVPFCMGLRSPAGVGMSPDDELFYTDNQGDWIPTSTLSHLERDKFYGQPMSLLDHPDFQGTPVEEIPLEKLAEMRVKPAIYFPHGELANSPGNPVWDTTEGKFGPFTGQVFVGDQGRSNLARISLEKVQGAYQGVAFDFVDYLQSGAIRLAFAPDGSLWVGQTGRGWGSAGGKHFGLQRVIWDGKTVPFEVADVKLTKTGFQVSLTQPLGENVKLGTEAIPVERWGYNYWNTYGSPKVDVTPVPVTNLKIAEDRKSLELSLALVADQVYAFDFSALASEDGSAPTGVRAWYTLNQLLP